MEFTNLLVVKDHRKYGFGNVSIADEHFTDSSKDKIIINTEDLVAYPALINIHDHLAGNWLPRTAPSRPYSNTSRWVKEMRDTEPLLERKKFWKTNDLNDLTNDNGWKLAIIGMYKNIFSGVTVVLDHVPIQKDRYYDGFYINVIPKYQQGHSIALSNWWGGAELEKEMKKTSGKVPFVIHLAEGTDDEAKLSFQKLEKMGLLKKNSILVHCTALDKEDFKKISEVGASIAWCPDSNIFLLGTTLQYKTVMKLGINLCMGTDSTLSGSLNILEELAFAKKMFPELSYPRLFKMVTENPAKALMLENYHGKIENNREANLLITKKIKDNPYENLLNVKTKDIELLLYKGKPIYGKIDYLKYFSWDAKDFYLFELDEIKRFVIGHPEKILSSIEKAIGYKKHFDYLPF